MSVLNWQPSDRRPSRPLGHEEAPVGQLIQNAACVSSPGHVRRRGDRQVGQDGGLEQKPLALWRRLVEHLSGEIVEDQIVIEIELPGVGHLLYMHPSVEAAFAAPEVGSTDTGIVEATLEWLRRAFA